MKKGLEVFNGRSGKVLSLDELLKIISVSSIVPVGARYQFMTGQLKCFDLHRETKCKSVKNC